MVYWEETFAPKIKSGKRVIIAAHGNMLRALVKYTDRILADKISELNITTAVPLIHKLDDDLKPIMYADAIRHLSGLYLGNQEDICNRIGAVAVQTKKMSV